MRSSNFHFVIHCTALELVWDRKHEYFTRNLANVVFRQIQAIKILCTRCFFVSTWVCVLNVFLPFFPCCSTLDLNWQVQPPIYCYFLVCPAELVAVKYSIYIWIVSSYSKVSIVRPGHSRLLEFEKKKYSAISI